MTGRVAQREVNPAAAASGMLVAMLFSLATPADNECGPASFELVLASLQQFDQQRQPLELILASPAETAGLFLRVAPEIASSTRSQLLTHYPHAVLTRQPDSTLDPPLGCQSWTLSLQLCPDVFPIRRHAEFLTADGRSLIDPVASLLDCLPAGSGKRVRAVITLQVRPVHKSHGKRARRVLRHLDEGDLVTRPNWTRFALTLATRGNPVWRMASRLIFTLLRVSQFPSKKGSSELPRSPDRRHERESPLQAAAAKLNQPLFSVTATITVQAPADAHQAARNRLAEIAGTFTVFSVPDLASFRAGRIRQQSQHRGSSRGPSFLLSAEEVATLWHPPVVGSTPARLDTASCRQLEPPTILPVPETERGLAVLGRVVYRQRREHFGLREDDRFRHLLLIGKTGMGKSTVLGNLLLSDIRAGRGVCLIDPHGDLADSIAAAIPKRRRNDLCYFDAGNAITPPAFNPLECRDATPQQRALTASAVLACFRKVFELDQAPRLEHILRNCLLALVEADNATLPDIQRLLTDGHFRKSITRGIENPGVRQFWEFEFAGWSDRYRQEALPAVLNKLGPFLSNPLLCGIVSQRKSTFSFRRVMDDGKLLIINLSKGRMGEDASALLGSFLVSSLQLAAMSRADVSEESRQPFFAYVDEFQNFATESFATMLSESRKYRLALTLACQYLDQMNDATRAAVFGNIGTLLSFQIGASDAEAIAEQLGGSVEPTDLLQLPKYHACIRLLVDGLPSRGFTMQTLRPETR
ncbi:MAG: type IV secretory system conjugative DNA transfer family protein [Rhodopirellula sp.]|nr:type IV secretory system conjugative DNA transfer family protein [Rhodopirellula sp.]